jgi:hypothetical protein
MDGGNRGGCDDRAMIVCDRDTLLPCPRLVPRLSNSIAPCVATVLVPSPWSTLVSEVLRGCTMGHTGDACLPQRPISSPFREDCVDGRVMDGWVATGLCRYGQALPWPPRREAPHDEVKDARRAQCALETSLGHREVRDDTSLARWGRALDRHRRRCRLLDCCTHQARASHKACGRA